jgi:putative peptidoglycan lipid II flippase
MALLGPVLAQVMFTGRVEPTAARLIGETLALSAFGLAPFALVMLQMRVCYAHNDLRTPTVINAVMVAVKIAVIAVTAALAPAHIVVVMLGVAGSLSYVTGAVLGHVLLRRRYGLLGFSTVAATFTRVVWAAAIAGWAGLVAMALTRHAVAATTLAHLLMAAAGAGVGIAVFLAAAKTIGIPEVRRARTLLIAR